ncbi:hypothetical protein [Bdellovibrio sp. NC01]|uniref:hypothetical protein n=1 Tax=Bdellovibrio sp. NC01 TaxID=2220073 RepID=UPI00115990F9|nr:hypothetical protein [Bdellovibrio sp. NC01]QDK37006.1 hypothetical protein DOE51_05060 [Bdellovibrio sp. NC01]
MMKALLSLLVLFGVASASTATAASVDPRDPLPWVDVTWKGFYYLTSDLVINDKITFKQGEKFNFVEVMGGGGYVPVTFFDLQVVNCPDPKAKEELFLINPYGHKGEEIGVELRENCRIVFFVENNLVGGRSIFTDSTE